MTITSASEARDLGKQLSREVTFRHPAEAYILLAPILAERTPFCLLDLIGKSIGRQIEDFILHSDMRI